MGWGRSKSEPDANDPAALLDQLMGSTRNLTETEKVHKKPPWEEQDCCPSFLAGLCPNHIFSLSSKRSELPPCEHAVHNPSIRAEFQRANLPVLAKHEQHLLGKLKRLVREMDERVVKTKDRVKLEAASVELEPGLKKSTEALGELTAKIAALVNQAEEAGNEGDVEVAEKSLADVEELTKQKKALETQLASNKEAAEELAAIRITGTMFGEQEVCEVCCSVTNKKDELNNERHREGQMHIGWTQIREEVARLEKKGQDARAGGGGGGGKGGAGELEDGEEEEGELKGEVAGGGGGGGHRGRGRSRSRSRDRHRDRDRDHHRDGGRHRDDDRRGRSRSRSRSRDRYRRRDRSDSRGRGRGGGGGGGGGRDGDRDRHHRRDSRDRDRDYYRR
jgi:RNA-binding protein Luc7-like 2